jgi:hypothetical protein
MTVIDVDAVVRALDGRSGWESALAKAANNGTAYLRHAGRVLFVTSFFKDIHLSYAAVFLKGLPATKMNVQDNCRTLYA